jgi:hypothetical protein
VLLLLVAAGCVAPSEEDVQRRFNEYVSGANACTAVSECAVARADCPLGCGVAVRSERVADVEAKGRELVKEYQRGGRSCAYGGCRPLGPLACVNNRCAILWDGVPDGGVLDGFSESR